MSRIPRLLQIVMEVASRREGQHVTRETLADHCECAVRTIARDIEDLRAVPIPLHWDRDRGS